jgi:cytochrome P450
VAPADPTTPHSATSSSLRGGEPSSLSSIFGVDVADPYPLYRALRANPVQWSDDLDAWLLSDHVKVLDALRDSRLACRVPALPDPVPSYLADLQPELRELYEFRRCVVLHSEGAVHARLRRVIQQAFMAPTLEALRPRIQQLADSLIDRVQAVGQMDLMDDLAFPLPTATIALFLGIPLRDMERFAHWCIDVFYAWPDALGAPDPRETVRGAHESLGNLRGHVASLLADGGTAGQECAVGALFAAAEQGDLTTAELAANLGFLSESGRNTTAYLIGNAVHSLLLDGGQLERLQQDTTLVEGAIEEFLRYDPPAMTVGRVALDDVEIGGASIRRGEHVMPLLCAANRDPALVDDPDRLDVTRPAAAHLSFGAGSHFCPGAPLARLEATIAIETLLRRLAKIQLAGAVEWHTHPTFRRMISLPVSWERP